MTAVAGLPGGLSDGIVDLVSLLLSEQLRQFGFNDL